MTQMGSETRSYNVMGQVTNIHSSSMNITYNFSATQNNGKITSQVDNRRGEQVTYAYDSLQRLISAEAVSSWGQGFAYDPFGNLTDKTVLAGSVPTLHIVPDALTNHLGGEDANGNSPGSMDQENRLVLAGTMRYATVRTSACGPAPRRGPARTRVRRRPISSTARAASCWHSSRRCTRRGTRTTWAR